MLFYLTTLNLARFLQEDAPDLGDNPDRQTVAAVDAWKHSDFLCKNYILNGLDNALYNVYIPMVNAKALWESLEKKYKTEDVGSKKFVVGKFLDFKMMDFKTYLESLQVVALIEKLPPTWKDFKNYLKYKRKEMKLEDLIVRLRIEEDNRQSEKKAGNYLQEAKVNVVEQDVLIKKYREAKSNLGKLQRLGVSLSYGVDATKMKLQTDLQMQKFDRIIYSFPHAGFHGKEDKAPLIRHINNPIIGRHSNLHPPMTLVCALY
ncbi:hypothetical protein RJ639_012940 [Escallonia herrerae]|uniref:25S rRNA (uridine-N(3))-methyltransferase BMT5-like domain-containing protein n=1 Tax=Escallonia herrerae TaxID=1293975 RepID=A0AA88VMU4_9ASTE|nr:hypothetical protein RJ639_012940 [Escallonia herrerae]